MGGTMRFFKEIIKELMEMGNSVDLASNIRDSLIPDCYKAWGCKIYPISYKRSPLSKENFIAIREIRELVKKNRYDIVHCHTPIAATCVRIACRKMRKKGLKVFYTAHGFHFYKGASLKSWCMYYPIEWICAHWTDVLITINKEDFSLAKRKMKATQVEYVPGIGINIKEFSDVAVDKEKKRKEIGIPLDAYFLLSVGELNSNKNHEIIIQLLAHENNKKIHYAVAGCGELEEYLNDLIVKLKVEEQVHLLGTRQDVKELLKIADVYVHPSYREGLPVAVMEAIAAQVPVICSDIRGCQDLVEKEYLFQPNDKKEILTRIEKVLFTNNRFELTEKNYKNLKKFDISNVLRKMIEIYYYSDCGVFD